MTDITVLSQDLVAQTELIRTGQLSAYELMNMQLKHIHKLNPKLNAFIQVNEVDPQQGVNYNSPLVGVSIAVKDNIDVTGFNTTAGLATRQSRQANEDAFVVAKLRQHGAQFSGKLNMHEGALGASNHNSHYGDCYNPHLLGHSPGGSSGGSGAAVASAMTALALGTDTMGSVRIPASYCGIFGFKGSRGVISNRGSVVCSREMDNIGPMARSARDLQLAFDIMRGFDWQSAQSQALKLTTDLPEKPILLVPDDLDQLGVEQNIIDDFNNNLQAFIDLGCQIKYFSLSGYDFAAARRAGLLICEAEMRIEHGDDWQHNQELFSPYLTSLLSYIDRKSPMDIIDCERVLDNAKVFARGLFQQGHFLLMPTTPQRAFSMTESAPANQADLTSLANQAGLCAVSMPMLTDHSLPAGMQLLGPSGSDLQILKLTADWQQLSQYQYQYPQALVD